MNKTDKTLTEAEATAIVNEAIDLDGRSEEHLSVAELEDRVEALGVPRTRIREALLARTRQAKEAEDRAREARRVRDRRIATAQHLAVRGWQGFTGLLTFLAIAGVVMGITLDSERDKALAAQEKVYSAIGRQQTTLSQTYSDPLNRDAEVAGAANRVYVAKADYDHFVAEYNSDANYVQWFLRVSHILPTRLPFAREVWR
jgi:hypothetical protein